jgi:hypothetical protein
MAQLLLDILVTRSFAKGFRRESPHKLPAKLLKSTREREGFGKKGRHSRPKAYGRQHKCLRTNQHPRRLLRPGLQGARSIAPIRSLSTHCNLISGGAFSALRARTAPVSHEGLP